MTRCEAPIPHETLVALWAGDLADAEGERVETHLFGCESCAAASDGIGRLVGGLREAVPPAITHAHREKLRERGLRLLETPVAAGASERAHFSPDVDLMVHVLQGDFTRAARVDVDLVTSDRVTMMKLEDVPFDAARGELLIACQRHYEHMFPGCDDLTFRVFAVEGDRRDLVGSYLVHHVWR